MLISKRAGVKSDKPAYKKKEKSDSGNTIYRYDEGHLARRWDEKKKKLKKIEKSLDKLRTHYRKDLESDDDRTRALAAIVGIMEEAGVRVGNKDSASEGTYGATTLKVKHVKGTSGNMTFDFPGKGSIEQNITIKNNEVIKAIRDLMKGKKKDDYIFEIDGKMVGDRAVNRYLDPFDISAKDLRGFRANKLMEDMLKKKDFEEALEEVAEIVGHEPATLKNQYLDPELVEKHTGKEKKASISSTAEELSSTESVPVEPPTEEETGPISDPDNWKNQLPIVDTDKNVANVYTSATLTPSIQNAWSIIAPFMPEGTYLSSAYRGPNEQAKIILEYWRSYLGRPGKWGKDQGVFTKAFSEELGISDKSLRVLYWKAINEKRFYRRDIDMLNKMVEYMTTKSLEGVSAPDIAPVGKSEHDEGVAFDITGGNIGTIYKTLLDVVSLFPTSLQLLNTGSKNPLVEQGNQAVHVVLAKSVTMPSREEFVKKLQSRRTATVNKDSIISVRSELRPDDLEWVRNLKKLSPRQQGVQNYNVSDKQRGMSNIGSSVKLNNTILSAWLMIQPFLPQSAKMTSGVRTLDDQKNIIERAWKKYRGSSYYPQVNDLSQKANILTKRFNYIVAPPKMPTHNKPSHLLGNAFDVSGADLNSIAAVVMMLSKDTDMPVRFTALIEPTNNSVHVNVYDVKYDTEALARAKNKYRGIAIADNTHDAQVVIAPYLYEDMIASNVPKRIIAEFAEIFDIDMIGGKELDDDMGDWFEKSRIFIDKEESDSHDIHDIGNSDAGSLAKEDPEKFFYQGLHKEHPDLESVALAAMIEDNPKFYFVFKYHEREEDVFKDLMEIAAETLSLKDSRAFFYYHLHHKFPELGRGAIVQIVDTNPDTFFDLGLDKDYPDYIESANNARNIKDPNKVELEQPEWLDKDVATKLSSRCANSSITRDDGNYIESPGLEDEAPADKVVPRTTETVEITPRNTETVEIVPRTTEIAEDPPEGNFWTIYKKKYEPIPENDSEALSIDADFFLRNSDLKRLFPHLIDVQVARLSIISPTMYFINKYHLDEKYDDLNSMALDLLIDFAPDRYFNMALFLSKNLLHAATKAAVEWAENSPKDFIKHYESTFKHQESISYAMSVGLAVAQE